MAEWISVKDRLPDEGKNVLVFLKSGIDKISGVDIAYLEWSSDFQTYSWVTERNICMESAVTHWIPIPEPPK